MSIAAALRTLRLLAHSELTLLRGAQLVHSKASHCLCLEGRCNAHADYIYQSSLSF